MRGIPRCVTPSRGKSSGVIGVWKPTGSTRDAGRYRAQKKSSITLERGRQQTDVAQGDIAYSALDAADVRACQTTFQRELFLRPAERFSQSGQVLAEQFPGP